MNPSLIAANGEAGLASRPVDVPTAREIVGIGASLTADRHATGRQGAQGARGGSIAGDPGDSGRGRVEANGGHKETGVVELRQRQRLA